MRAERWASRVVLAIGATGALGACALAGARLGAPGLALLAGALALPFALRRAGRILSGDALPRDVRPALALATAFGIGRVPHAPGTAGTAAGLVVVAATASMPWVQAALAAMLVAVGAVAAEVAARHRREPDAPWIVIDEVAGMMVAMIGVPLSPGTALAGFALFRLFDVAKPFPARWIDDHVPTGPGTMLDDVVSGLWTLGVLHAGRLLLCS